MLSACLTPMLDDFKVDFDSTVFESVFPDPENMPCLLKDEIFNLHLFLKPLVKIADLSETQRTVKVSYFDSKKKEIVGETLKLETTDAFACDKELQESIFKMGK